MEYEFSRTKLLLGTTAMEQLAKAVPGSVAFVPSVTGLILAGEVSLRT